MELACCPGVEHVGPVEWLESGKEAAEFRWSLVGPICMFGRVLSLDSTAPIVRFLFNRVSVAKN